MLNATSPRSVSRKMSSKQSTRKIKEIVVGAAKFAEDTPEPAPAELYTDVLVGSTNAD